MTGYEQDGYACMHTGVAKLLDLKGQYYLRRIKEKRACNSHTELFRLVEGELEADIYISNLQPLLY